MPVPKELMEILVCPKCKGELKEKGMFLVCEHCSLAYPVLNDEVPDMLIDDAWKLEDAEKSGFKHNMKL